MPSDNTNELSIYHVVDANGHEHGVPCDSLRMGESVVVFLIKDKVTAVYYSPSSVILAK